MVPYTCPAKYISGGQQEEGHGVINHVQGEHHQSYESPEWATCQKSKIMLRSERCAIVFPMTNLTYYTYNLMCNCTERDFRK